VYDREARLRQTGEAADDEDQEGEPGAAPEPQAEVAPAALVQLAPPVRCLRLPRRRGAPLAVGPHAHVNRRPQAATPRTRVSSAIAPKRSARYRRDRRYATQAAGVRFTARETPCTPCRNHPPSRSASAAYSGPRSPNATGASVTGSSSQV